MSLKNELPDLLRTALLRLADDGVLESGSDVAIQISYPRDAGHGDYATNLALALAKAARRPPRELAEAIVAALPDDARLERAEVAGPGFINFFERGSTVFDVVGEVLEAGERFGRSSTGAGRKVQVEFVSANPTGPLHVGHGRGAAYGATLANLQEAVGFDVQREYYVNDAGRQMNILAASVWLRYLELAGETVPFPSNGYRGDYVWDVAATLHRNEGDALRHPIAAVLDDVPPDAPAGDKETHIDGVIERAQTLLGDTGFALVFRLALDTILDDIRNDLRQFGVVYDRWFSEHSLVTEGDMQRAIARLEEAGHLYQRDGATWFRSSAFGDEKDRVVVRDNGQATYFASDIAYLMNKLDRGFETMTYVWGADHHGYVARLKAVAQAFGVDPERVNILLVQFAILYRGTERVQMSTRSGEFVTLRELREEVGTDAARFFYVMRRCEQHLDFDLELAKSQKNDNPVYYIQYAHARICSVLRELPQRGWQEDREAGLANLALLVEDHEQALARLLEQYPTVIERAAQRYEPHQLANYLRDLANGWHTYYNAHRLLVDDQALRNARLVLAEATRQVVSNGLNLLGVRAPESM